MRITVPDNLRTESTTTNLDVEDPRPEWVAGTYSIGDVAWKASTHRVYRSAVDNNTDDPEVGVRKDPKTWIDIAPTNAWAFRDEVNTTQTVRADSLTITHELVSETFLSAIDLFNISATDVQITLTSDQAGGQFFDKTFCLENFENINDLFDYRYAAFRPPLRSLAVSGFQAYTDTVATITLTSDGADVALGNIVIGESLEIGATLTDFTTPIMDYSRRTVDEFGNVFLKDFGSSKQFRGQVAIPINDVNYVYETLSDLAGTPVSFVGDSRYTGSIVYGTVSIIPAYSVTDVSIATVKVEGLK